MMTKEEFRINLNHYCIMITGMNLSWRTCLVFSKLKDAGFDCDYKNYDTDNDNGLFNAVFIDNNNIKLIKDNKDLPKIFKPISFDDFMSQDVNVGGIKEGDTMNFIDKENYSVYTGTYEGIYTGTDKFKIKLQNGQLYCVDPDNIIEHYDKR